MPAVMRLAGVTLVMNSEKKSPEIQNRHVSRSLKKTSKIYWVSAGEKNHAGALKLH